MSVNNSYDEATCRLRASSPLRHDKNRGNICHCPCKWQVPTVCDRGGKGRERHPQRMHLAEVKYHTAAINKRTGTLALE